MLSRMHGEVEVIQELPGGGERVISSGERVNLAGAGVEHFKVRHLSKDVTVIYNEHEKSIPRGVYTTEQLKEIFKVEAGYVLDIVRGVEFVELTPGEQIRVHNGQKFFSHAPCGQSS
jgi:predicted metallopeptidase